MYREIYGILIIKSKEYKYYKEKLTEFPSQKLSKLKRGSFILLIKIIIIPIVPVWLIYMLYYKIRIHSLRTRLKLMNNLANDIIVVVQDPEFLNLKK